MLFMVEVISHQPTQNKYITNAKLNMAATIKMPPTIDQSIRSMCADAMTQAVEALAAKYGFNAEEANRFLASNELKIVRKGKAKTKKETTSDEDKPKTKRPLTGYLLYAKEVRQEVKDELTAELEEGTKLKPQEVVKLIAIRWKGEDQEVRDEWNLKAKTPATSDDETESPSPPEVEVEVVDPKPKKSKKTKKLEE